MLERMWKPPLGDGKMAGMRRRRKQKVQLFEDQIKAKKEVFYSLERLREAQLAPKGIFEAYGQEARPTCKWSSIRGYSFTGLRQRVWTVVPLARPPLRLSC